MSERIHLYRQAKTVNETENTCRSLLELVIHFKCATPPWFKRVFCSVPLDEEICKCYSHHFMSWYFYESSCRNAYSVLCAVLPPFMVWLCVITQYYGQEDSLIRVIFHKAKSGKKKREHLKSHLLPAESSVLCTSFLQRLDFTGTYDCASIPAKPVMGSLTSFLSGGAFYWPLLMPEIKKSMTSLSGLVLSWKVPLRLAQTWETIGLDPINAAESWSAFRSSLF